MSKRKKRYDDDDGRTIVRMNVDGMPWYVPGAEKNRPAEGERSGTQEELRGVDRWAFIWGMMKAILLVLGCFVVVYLLFILFATKVWFA